jgi:septum formation protein
MKTIILASASPRRKSLLEQIGLKFKVDPSDYEEKLEPGRDPREQAQMISLAKAESVASRHKNSIIIAADTFGVLNGKIIGKPHTEKEAKIMLKELSGKSHTVITGFTIIDTGNNKKISKSTETRVYFRELTPDEIDWYVSSGEPLDKAGAYAIQGLGAVVVEKIEGDYNNVIGLPLSDVTEALKEFGVNVLDKKRR